MTIGWGVEGGRGKKGGLEAGVSPVVGQPSGLKGTVPIVSCPHWLTGLTIWDLGACGDQGKTPGAGALAQSCTRSGGLAQAIDSRKY